MKKKKATKPRANKKTTSLEYLLPKLAHVIDDIGRTLVAIHATLESFATLHALPPPAELVPMAPFPDDPPAVPVAEQDAPQ